MAGWKRFVSLLLVLVIVGSAVSPVMAVEIDSQEFKQQKLNSMFVKLLWENWPHKDYRYEIKWGGSTHRTIAEEVGRAMGIGDPYLTTFKEYSVKPDEEDEWWDRFYKHVYDPYFLGGWGGAPSACAEKVNSAISYARQNKLTEAYQELGRAAHYLMDVGNPYHSNLLPPDKPRHDCFELRVEQSIINGDEWQLRQIARNAPIIPVSDPEQAVKDLAKISNEFRSELDKTMWVDPEIAEAYVTDEEKMKELTQELIEVTAGYVKGLIQYFRQN